MKNYCLIAALFASACISAPAADTSSPVPGEPQKTAAPDPTTTREVASHSEAGNALDKNRRLIVDEAFLIKAMDTPSPPREIWNRIAELFRLSKEDSEKAILEIVTRHLSRDGPPSKQELEAFIARQKQNLAFIEGGEFWFGDWGVLPGKPGPVSGGDDNKPPQRMKLSNFSIQKTLVTYADYDVYTRASGQALHEVNSDEDFLLDLPFRFPDYPVRGLPWDSAHKYCKWLATTTGKPFELPTETQWEYVARNRGQEIFFAGPYPMGGRDLGKLIEREGLPPLSAQSSISIPVKAYGAGAIGVFDMVGYWQEWVYDWYSPNLTGRGNSLDYSGPRLGTERVIRNASADDFRTAVTRHSRQPNNKEQVFRCALNSDGPWK